MEAGLPRDVLTLLLGFATGVLSALFGIGGAIVSNPGLRALGADPLVAVGTTLPSILPGAISGTLRYRHEGLIDWHVIAPAADDPVIPVDQLGAAIYIARVYVLDRSVAVDHVLAVTAEAMPEQVRKCLAAGMDAHVAKPIEIAKLYDAISAVLNAAATGGAGASRAGAAA